MAAWHAGGQEFESPWLHWVFTKWVSPNRAKARAKMLWPFCFALNPPVRGSKTRFLWSRLSISRSSEDLPHQWFPAPDQCAVGVRTDSTPCRIRLVPPIGRRSNQALRLVLSIPLQPRQARGPSKGNDPHSHYRPMGFLAVAGCMLLATAMSAALTSKPSKA